MKKKKNIPLGIIINNNMTYEIVDVIAKEDPEEASEEF